MILSWSPSIRVAKMRARELSLDAFLATFAPASVREQPTKDGPNYIAGRLLDYDRPRGKGNVIDRCAVVLDCDDADQAGIAALCEGVRGLGVLSVVHSTYSSTPDAPRVRVVIPLASPVVPGDYVALCRALMAHLSMVTWDESCAQAERAMYMPAKPVGGEYWAIRTDGPLMDGLEWLKTHAPAVKARKSKGNVAKRDRKRRPENDPGIQGAFNRVYSIEDAIETYDLPYEPCRDGRWTLYGSHTEGGLRLVEDREDLCISEHANSDPAHFVDGNGSIRALSAYELCAVHLYGEDDDTSAPPRERASMQAMAVRAAEDEAVRAELAKTVGGGDDGSAADAGWLAGHTDDTYTQAKRAAAALRDRLAYVEGLGWLTYTPDRGVWEVVHESAALNAVADVILAWYRGAVLTGDADLTKRVAKLRHVSAARSILAHLPIMVSVPASGFDADPDLLCTPTGVVDLRTGELRPHGAQYRMMQCTAAPYVPGATHEAWTRALQALDAPERAWLQRWIGCGLTGYQPDDNGAATPILTGGGSNGKSVIMTGVARALGGYAHMGAHALLTPDGGKDLLRAAASLRGVRLCYVEELPDGVLNGNAVKQLSATPTVKGEFKFRDEFEFAATHSLMVSANVMPRLDEGTDAVVRRLAVLPFHYRYVPTPTRRGDKLADAGLLRALETREAQAAILAWAVDGARAYFAAGQHVLPASEGMQAAKDSWLGNIDTLAGFFTDMLVADEDAMIPWTHLYAAFADWQRENGGKAWNKATFKNRVASHRLFAGMTDGKLRTAGISLYSDGIGGGPATPTGGRVAGLRGLRFRRPSDDVEPVEAPEVADDALIAAEDIPDVTPHVAPERDEVERREVVAAIDAMVRELYGMPGGRDEVDRLAAETGCSGPGAPLGVLRAFRMRLHGACSVLQGHR
nr:MAG TPA: dsDNA helicase [Caudoviricetes sp.]